MRLLPLLIVAALLVADPRIAAAQLLFQNSLDEYKQPKSEWKKWAKTEVGDYIEYRIVGKDEATNRFELIEKGDHTLLIRSIRPNPFGGERPPVVKEHRHVFVDDAFVPKRGEFSQESLEFGGEEVPATKEVYFNPINKQTIKQVWFIEDAPFDGMVKYEQFRGGKLDLVYVAEYGNRNTPPQPRDTASATPPVTDITGEPMPTEPMPAEPETEEEAAVRKWTSRDGKFTVMASLVKYEKGRVHLKLEGKDQVIPVPLLKLSREDQQHVRQLEKQRETEEE